MELDILYNIQKLHNPVLDPIMVGLSYIGEFGIIWIILATIFISTKKYRLCGITMLIAMTLGALSGNLLLKNIFARPRPSWIDHNVILLIKNPVDFSFPSGHALNSFASAVTIFIFHKKLGIFALILATFIAFSRLYLFFHYPTDILAGIVLGVLISLFSVWLVKMSDKRYKFNFLNNK
jgi:undecaprenyl-diphosphatase